MRSKKEDNDILRQIHEDLKGTETEKDFRAFLLFSHRQYLKRDTWAQSRFIERTG
jgi:hypothetical protein